MKNKAEEEEVWKTYPELPFIEASSLGRVRTKDRTVTYKDGAKHFYKGVILKQHLTKNGYKYISFSANGKTIHLYVHRVIAITFLPNPNNLPEVNHINNDPTNNRLDNLEWCTREHNISYREKYGKSAVEVSGRPVFAVNLETSKVFWFKSRSEAARQLGIAVRDVSSVIKGRQKTASGYWFTEDESEITKEKIKEIKNNMRFYGGVIAINLDNFTVLHFESQAEAARQLGVSHGTIYYALKSLQRITKSYWLCYADENAVEKVRKRFGNDIACKVKELMKQK